MTNTAPRFKIIAVDNYARESVADSLVCENVTETYGNTIVELMNADLSRPDNNWYKLVPMDHKLWRGMEELI